jgi:phospholipid/cholesterol/gamma-HCH transport system substrate-binding protein
MNRNVLETVMGALVLAVAVIFLAFAYSSAGIRTVAGYEVTAKFDRVNGLKTGGDVRISGVKVGTITATKLDPKSFTADVNMVIDGAFELPVDTVAEITSTGLLGDEFMNLVPGNDDKNIAHGGAIQSTVPPTDLMQLLKQMAFSFTGGSSSSSGAGGGSGSPPAAPTPAPSDPTPSAAPDHKS